MPFMIRPMSATCESIKHICSTSPTTTWLLYTERIENRLCSSLSQPLTAYLEMERTINLKQVHTDGEINRFKSMTTCVATIQQMLSSQLCFKWFLKIAKILTPNTDTWFFRLRLPNVCLDIDTSTTLSFVKSQIHLQHV